MVDQVSIIVASVISGLAGGFISSWMAFNASGEEFDKRKHGNGLITGAIAGMALGLGFSIALPKDATAAQIAISLFTTFFATVGIDKLRTNASKMTTREQFNKLTEMIKTQKIPPPAPAPPASVKPETDTATATKS